MQLADSHDNVIKTFYVCQLNKTKKAKPVPMVMKDNMQCIV